MDVFRKHRYVFRSFGVAFDGELGKFWSTVVDVVRWINYVLSVFTHSLCISLGVLFRHPEFTMVPNLVMTCGTFSGPCFFFKLNMLYRRRHQVQDLMKHLNGYEVKSSVGTFTKALMYCYESMAIFFGLASLLKNAVEAPDLYVPYPVWEPYQINTQFRRTVHFIMFYAAVAMCWLVFSMVDTSLLHMSNQLCHKLAVLDHTLRLVGADAGTRAKILGEKEILPLDNYEDETIVKVSLAEHFKLIHLTNSLAEILNENFLYQIISGMPVMLVTLYIFSNSKDWVNDTLAFSGALVVVFVEVLTTTWSGELIKTRYDQLHFAVYNSQWYEGNEKIKSSLLIMATYSTRPVVLRGAYVFDLSLQTYETFIRQAFSLLAVMYQFLN